MKAKGRILGIALAISLLFCSPSAADEDLAIGGAAQSGGAGAVVDLDFRIVIPEFIYFRVGAGADVEIVEFAPDEDEVRNGATIGPVDVEVRLISNVGNIDITSATAGPLASGADQISFGAITTGSQNGNIAAPTLIDAGNDSVTINTANQIINLSDTWQYTYDPGGVIPAAGTYTGTATYTAAAP